MSKTKHVKKRRPGVLIKSEQRQLARRKKNTTTLIEEPPQPQECSAADTSGGEGYGTGNRYIEREGIVGWNWWNKAIVSSMARFVGVLGSKNILSKILVSKVPLISTSWN